MFRGKVPKVGCIIALSLAAEAAGAQAFLEGPLVGVGGATWWVGRTESLGYVEILESVVSGIDVDNMDLAIGSWYSHELTVATSGPGGIIDLNNVREDSYHVFPSLEFSVSRGFYSGIFSERPIRWSVSSAWRGDDLVVYTRAVIRPNQWYCDDIPPPRDCGFAGYMHDVYALFGPESDLNRLSVRQRRFRFDIVPEPASWAMMIAGFGLVGGALRRRREQMPA